jgi:uncharacterized tellurite resistance protein B-like protein
MDFKNLSVEQRNALLDLLVLGMYSDGHVARSEDARIERILRAMGFASQYDRDREFDAATTRVRAGVDAERAARELGKVFSSKVDRADVVRVLTELIGSDSRVTAEETRFLETVKGVFGD